MSPTSGPTLTVAGLFVLVAGAPVTILTTSLRNTLLTLQRPPPIGRLAAAPFSTLARLGDAFFAGSAGGWKARICWVLAMSMKPSITHHINIITHQKVQPPLSLSIGLMTTSAMAPNMQPITVTIPMRFEFFESRSTRRWEPCAFLSLPEMMLACQTNQQPMPRVTRAM